MYIAHFAKAHKYFAMAWMMGCWCRINQSISTIIECNGLFAEPTYIIYSTLNNGAQHKLEARAGQLTGGMLVNG